MNPFSERAKDISEAFLTKNLIHGRSAFDRRHTSSTSSLCARALAGGDLLHRHVFRPTFSDNHARLHRRGDRPTRHGNEVRLEQGEYLLAVVWDIRTIDDMRDLSLFVDDEGDTINYPHRGHYAAKQAATRDAISSRGCHIGVSKQGKVEMILLREALV